MQQSEADFHFESFCEVNDLEDAIIEAIQERGWTSVKILSKIQEDDVMELDLPLPERLHLIKALSDLKGKQSPLYLDKPRTKQSFPHGRHDYSPIFPRGGGLGAQEYTAPLDISHLEPKSSPRSLNGSRGQLGDYQVNVSDLVGGIKDRKPRDVEQIPHGFDRKPRDIIPRGLHRKSMDADDEDEHEVFHSERAPLNAHMAHHATRLPTESALLHDDVTYRHRSDGPGCCGYILMVLSYMLIVVTLPISLCLCIKVVQEYERAVIFRLGLLLPGGAKGPGLFFIIPCMDSYTKVDLRTVSFDVPPQEVLSKDSVTVAVDAVVYYRVSNATVSITNVEDANRSTRLLAATTLRNVLGTKDLSEILSDRENISHTMQDSLDVATDAWGIKVERVEIKDVRLPVQLQRAMAAEAEAAREARAKVIAAEGEMNASRALKEAANIISESPSALQLRYLQTLNTISAEKNSTIIFPVPVDFINGFMNKGNRGGPVAEVKEKQ